MADQNNIATTISVDLKKFRIRIYKSALHQIGDPSMIQLLVNPGELAVAIRAVDKEYSGDSVHRVRQKIMTSDNSVEIYSRSFIEQLCAVTGGLDSGKTYRISGTIIPSEKVALFSLKTMKKVSVKGG